MKLGVVIGAIAGIVAPSRERELKRLTRRNILSGRRVAPSRERELKLIIVKILMQMYVAPSRERELKLYMSVLCRYKKSVAPSRERELKQICCIIFMIFRCRSLTGA